jgi:diacylglycerol kinase (ATP)
VRTVLIANPRAGRGRGSATAEEIAARLGAVSESVDVLFTRGPGDAEALARDAIRCGAQRIVAIGGDGTLGECANGLLHGGARTSDVELGLIPLGTGRDFVRSLWPRTDIDFAIDRVVHGALQRIDVARLQASGHDGTPLTRHFINAMSLGLGGVVAAQVERSNFLKRVLGARVFAASTLRALMGRHSWPISIAADGEKPAGREICLGVFSNGRFFGGAMEIAPGARLDDAKLDMIIADRMSAIAIVRLLLSVYSGHHLRHPKLSVRQVSRASIDCKPGDVVLIEIDGEPVGRLPASVEVLPGAVLMRA